MGGIEKAKALGVPFGRHNTLTPQQIGKLQAKRQEGTTIRALIKEFSISKSHSLGLS